MHMANELLDLPTSALTLALGAAAVGLAIHRLRGQLPPEKLPLLGVLGAFVFAAQMINFSLPLLPGTSAHLGGAVLLAILLGPSAAIVVMTAVLMVQCLLFQDGGLLALGCNIINMGVVPALAGGWIYRRLLGRPESAGGTRRYLACWAACTVGVAAGAALVPVETLMGGRLLIDARDFLAVMLGLHLVIGLIEGTITSAVLGFLARVRPAVLGLSAPPSQTTPRSRWDRLAMPLPLLATALLLAGLGSWFASAHPDGLEWSLLRGGEHSTLAQPTGLAATIDRWQKRWSLMTDYTRRDQPLGQESAQNSSPPAVQSAWPNPDGWKSLAGLVGTLATLAALAGISQVLRTRRHARHADHAP
jgi:cobalt/nickel transport system permease protein